MMQKWMLNLGDKKRPPLRAAQVQGGNAQEGQRASRIGIVHGIKVSDKTSDTNVTAATIMPKYCASQHKFKSVGKNMGKKHPRVDVFDLFNNIEFRASQRAQVQGGKYPDKMSACQKWPRFSFRCYRLTPSAQPNHPFFFGKVTRSKCVMSTLWFFRRKA